MKGQVEQVSEIPDLRALEAFVVENDDLEKLEGLMGQFNIFEAIGAVRRELRHSDLLAFLLNPLESHGLGDVFARRLLQRAIREAGPAPTAVSPIEIDVWDPDYVEVRREWNNIDVLVVDERSKIAVIIENKIDTGEHSDQLARYHRHVSESFPSFRVLPLFLTPDGVAPSDDRYIAIGYELVAALVKSVAESRRSTMGPDVYTVLVHYAQMLERHIVSDSDIAKLCGQIYKKHRRALDLILEHRPDRLAYVREVLEAIVQRQREPLLLLDQNSKQYIRFVPKRWDDSPLLKQGTGWTRTGRMLLFEFGYTTTGLTLRLVLGPGPSDTRERVVSMANADPELFKGSGRTMWKKWNQLYTRPFAPAKVYAEDEEDEAVEAALQAAWPGFANEDLLRIIEKVNAEGWLWKPAT